MHKNQNFRHIQRTKTGAHRPKAVARPVAACLQLRAASPHGHNTATQVDAARRIDNLRISRESHGEQTKARVWLMANKIKLGMAALTHPCMIIVRSHQVAASRRSQTKCLRQERRLQLAFKVAERSLEARHSDTCRSCHQSAKHGACSGTPCRRLQTRSTPSKVAVEVCQPKPVHNPLERNRFAFVRCNLPCM